jgi:hypothetical protein
MLNPPQEDRGRLSNEYKVATGHYAWAVAELNRQIATCSAEDWKKLNRVVDEARNECERIRAELASTHY